MWNGAEELSAEAYFTLGDNAERHGDLSAAEEHYKRALAIHEQKKNGIEPFPSMASLATLRDSRVTQIPRKSGMKNSGKKHKK